MSKKTNKKSWNEKIHSEEISQVLEKNYMPYAMSVIVSRAIPEIDGFKPSHRKLLYTMYLMGLLNGPRSKSSNCVGQTMKLNPHGEGAIYETLVRLTSGYDALLVPMIDSKGNFGKVYSRDMAYAASRYTEVKLAPICHLIFDDIDKNTVDFVDNYDGQMKEPTLLPTKFPNILVNPNQGIAVGMASYICSFNLTEVCETTIAFMKNPNIQLLNHLKAPDFSTGGELIYKENELQELYDKGKGSFKLRAKYRYDKKNNCIEVYEIPYTTTIEAIIDKISNMVKSGKIKEVSDVRDETDLKGLKLTIDLKRGVDSEKLMHKLFKHTSLMDSVNCNFNILIHGKPRLLSVKDILSEWVDFRISSIQRQYLFDVDKMQAKSHLLQGLEVIVLDIDKAIRIIRNTELEKDVVENLMKGFSIDKLQAEYIADMKLRNINKEYLLKRIRELEELSKNIAHFTEIASDHKKIKKVIEKELKEIIKTFGRQRKTEIITHDAIETFEEHELVEDYEVSYFLTKENYFKKIPLLSIIKNNEQKLKEEDQIIASRSGLNRNDLLFFSDQANMYRMKASDIVDHKASIMGEYLPNLLEMEEDEKMIYFTSTSDYSGHMLFVFENGKAAKIPLASYETNRKKLISAYSQKSKLIFISHVQDTDDVLFIRDTDKAALVNVCLIPEKISKKTIGVQIYQLKKNSQLTTVILKEDFNGNIDYYRTKKIPTTGHFLTEPDKEKNNLNAQIKLF